MSLLVIAFATSPGGNPAAAAPPTLADGILTVEAGDYQVDFKKQSAWTIRSIRYRGVVLISPSGGNQAVLRLPDPERKDPLFIGNVHGGEQVESFTLVADGRPHPVAEGMSAPAANEYVVIKESLMGPIRYRSSVKISPQGIEESASFQLESDPAGAEWIYAFMHCWAPEMSRWIAVLPDGSREEGAFRFDGTNTLKKDLRSLVVWSETTGTGAVMTYDEAYEGRPKLHNFLWNRQRDSKHYFQVSIDQALARTSPYVCRIVGFQASPQDWEKVALGTEK
ncbi:MAG TPA: hypothetical protein VNQ90_11530 [Chthoniobacteraceae bacterium]|nr:hypothetical protein [Chthoniobacteraceae bacterium]